MSKNLMNKKDMSQPSTSLERHSKDVGNHNPKSVSLSQRIIDFQNEPLTVSGNKLFCNSCHEFLCVKSRDSHEMLWKSTMMKCIWKVKLFQLTSKFTEFEY